tara:strand:+ start:3883 stop:4725 length:843 start_codon:yes stop_codon:yes gene_type:complete
MKRVFCIGNGESRRNVNLEVLRKFGKIYGCNAMYRDFTPDVLVAVDQGIIHEIYQSGYAYAHECYFRNWYIQEAKSFNVAVYGTNDPTMIKYIESLKLLKTNERGRSNKFVCGGSALMNFAKQVQKDPSKLEEYRRTFVQKVSWVRDDDKVQCIKDVQGGRDLGWAAGPTAVWLAIKNEEPQQVYLLGHDLNSDTNNINNLYKGTPNYNPINHKPTPSVNWFIQLQALMNENPDIAFYKVNREQVDNNSKVNRMHPEFNKFKNLTYITYEQLQNSIDKKW